MCNEIIIINAKPIIVIETLGQEDWVKDMNVFNKEILHNNNYQSDYAKCGIHDAYVMSALRRVHKKPCCFWNVPGINRFTIT